jgi:hypothetical protein
MSEPIREPPDEHRDKPQPEPTDGQEVPEQTETRPIEEWLAELDGVCQEMAKRLQNVEERLDKCEAQLKEHSEALETLRTQRPAGEASDPVEAMPSRWLIADIWHDVRLVVRMFRDARYRVAWTTSIIALGALIYLLFGTWLRNWLGWGWNVPVLSYVDIVVVAYLGLKVLSRELRRYEYFLQTRRGR